MIQAGHPLFEAWQRLNYQVRRSNRVVELTIELQIVESWILRNTAAPVSPEPLPAARFERAGRLRQPRSGEETA